MRPLTLECPKPLLKVHGRELLDLHLEKLAAIGIREVIINISWLAGRFRAAYPAESAYGMRIRWSHEPQCLETGGGVHNALPLLGDAPFLLINGDVFTDYDFARLLDAPEALAHLVLVANPPHHPAGDFHLETATGLVQEHGEPKHTFAGISRLHPDLFNGCRPGAFRLAPLLTRAMQAGRVTGEIHDGTWSDVGTPERLEALNR